MAGPFDIIIPSRRSQNSKLSFVDKVGKAILGSGKTFSRFQKNAHVPSGSLSGSSQIDFIVESDGMTTYIDTTQMDHPRAGDFVDLADLIAAKKENGDTNQYRFVLVSPNPKAGAHLQEFIKDESAKQISLMEVDELITLLKRPDTSPLNHSR